MSVQGMFSKNRHGKMACFYGFSALALSVAAGYSEVYGSNHDGHALIAPWLNLLLMPLAWLEGVWVNAPPIVEPTMMSPPLFRVFEAQAVVFTLAAAVLLCALSLRRTTLAARNHEFSLWYANGAAAGIHGLFSVDAVLGVVVLVLVIWAVERSRAHGTGQDPGPAG